MSNEQRAHDLAIAITSALFKTTLLQASNGQQVDAFDFYAEYKRAYDLTIDLISKDFN